MLHFVYQPRSGSRWLEASQEHAERGTFAIPVFVWGNGSAHAVGRRITVEAAHAGAWWRDTAREAADAIARRCGGLAWDDRGQVSLVVPPGVAEAALAFMWAADPYEAHQGQLLVGRFYEDLRQMVQVLGPSATLERLPLREPWLWRNPQPLPSAEVTAEEGKTVILIQPPDVPLISAPWRLEAAHGVTLVNPAKAA